MLYIPSPELTSLVTGGWLVPCDFTHFLHPLPLVTTSLFSAELWSPNSVPGTFLSTEDTAKNKAKSLYPGADIPEGKLH